MSYESSVNINFIAGEDLRNDAYKLLTLTNSGGIAKVIKATAATQVCVGVLAENPNPDVDTTGYGVPVTLLVGRVPMKAASPITAGNLVIAAAGGTVAGAAGISALSADVMSVGVALESAIAGDIFDVVAMPLVS
jgi:hypothetical protein